MAAAGGTGGGESGGGESGGDPGGSSAAPTGGPGGGGADPELVGSSATPVSLRGTEASVPLTVDAATAAAVVPSPAGRAGGDAASFSGNRMYLQLDDIVAESAPERRVRRLRERRGSRRPTGRGAPGRVGVVLRCRGGRLRVDRRCASAQLRLRRHRHPAVVGRPARGTAGTDRGRLPARRPRPPRGRRRRPRPTPTGMPTPPTSSRLRPRCGSGGSRSFAAPPE